MSNVTSTPFATHIPRNSFSRALSPSSIAIASATASSPAIPAGRWIALQTASTVTEVIGALPTSYREALKQPLTFLTQLVDQAHQTRLVLRRLESHKANKTWPPQLAGVQAPSLQPHKLFLEALPNALDNIKSITDKYRSDALDAMIAEKTAELEWYETQLKPDTYLLDIRKVVDRAWDGLKSVTRAAKYERDAMSGEISISGWVTDEIQKAIYNSLCEDLSTFCHTVLNIVRGKNADLEARAQAKQKVKDAVDVEMGDSQTSAKALGDIVAREVKALPLSVRTSSKWLNYADTFPSVSGGQSLQAKRIRSKGKGRLQGHRQTCQ